MKQLKISDIGEKRLISEFVRPLFNKSNNPEGVGDDCAMLEGLGGEVWLFSTDRVPADLIALRLGILDYFGLGQYLAWLNISDISACGGQPVALLLNLGLPEDLLYKDFMALCKGFGHVAEKYSCQVLGGDISSSRELSISATSIGKTSMGKILTRRGARSGDTIFISRPIGLTPAAFAYYLRSDKSSIALSEEEITILNGQFTSIEPLVSLGLSLSASGQCTSCMDNTDGLGQSLLELSIESGAAFVVSQELLELPMLVKRIAESLDEDPFQIAFSAGADFSLVGTLQGYWQQEQVTKHFGSGVSIIGFVDEGNGVYVAMAEEKRELDFSGWNYFSTSNSFSGD